MFANAESSQYIRPFFVTFFIFSIRFPKACVGAVSYVLRYSRGSHICGGKQLICHLHSRYCKLVSEASAGLLLNQTFSLPFGKMKHFSQITKSDVVTIVSAKEIGYQICSIGHIVRKQWRIGEYLSTE